jgi:putative ABC transport system permease protein
MLRGGGGIELPRLHEVALDARVLTATGLLTLLTALLAGFAPAWRAARSDPEAALKGARAAGHATGTRRVRSALVAAEIALALALLVGAGLLVRSFARLTGVDAGFQADHVLLAQVSLVSSSYEPDRWASYVERAVSELASLPGVTVAGGGAPLPLSGQQGLLRFGVRIEGQPEPADGRTDRAYLRWATPGYFRAMGIPLIQGRTFEDGDRRDTLPVAVVDRAFVRRYFPGSDPIGRRLRMTNERVARQIVGVVGSVRQTTLEDEAEPHVYVAQAQNPSPVMTFVIRTEGEPRALAAAVRERIQSLDPTRPVYNVRTLEALVAGSVAVRRFNAVLLALFAGLAVSLALVGVYGVMAYWVGESAKEIGLRIALGATRGRILRHLLGRSLRVTLAGVAGGLLLSLVAGRFVGGLLFGVLPTDPVTLAASTVAVLAAAGAASYFPARRALAIDPADALRID